MNHFDRGVHVRLRRAFTLIEVMVASSMGLVIVLAATSIATSMVRAARVAADGQALTTRAQIARGLILPALQSIGDGWQVDDIINGAFASPSSSGAMGEGYAVPSTNLGSGRKLFPLIISDGGPAAPDSLRAVIPRGGSLEPVQINSRGGGAALPTGCTTTLTTFDVVGATTQAWEINDLVLVSQTNAVTVARVTASFPASTSTTTRLLSLDMGAAADLQFNDGGRTGCDAATSLFQARVFPISVIDLRLNAGSLEIAESRSSTTVASPEYVPALERVDDLQFRLEIARFPVDGGVGSATMCTCNTAAILDAETVPIAAPNCSCSGTQRLNLNGSLGPALRIVGIQVGVLIRGDTQRNRPATAQKGLFNRTSNLANDAFVRHAATFYVGLPNAHAF